VITNDRDGPLHNEANAQDPIVSLEREERANTWSSSRLWALLRRLKQSKFALIGGFVVGLVIFAAIFAPLIVPYDPVKQDILSLLQGPSRSHLLGTDEIGRDTLSRVIYGARVSLMVGVIAVSISMFIGSALGLIAGYGRGLIDTVIMQIMDALLAFPALALALAITAMLGPSLNNAMIAIGITGIPAFARLVRGQVLSLRDLEYVQAARALGASNMQIIVKHILPNTMAPIIVQTSIAIPAAILAEAGLSFLGLGIQPPTPSWGAMLNTARGYIQMTPWLAIVPGVAIFVTVLAFNFLGDALRDTLDPRLR
jgi:peptide/nickel transport system permease protein